MQSVDACELRIRCSRWQRTQQPAIERSFLCNQKATDRSRVLRACTMKSQTCVRIVSEWANESFMDMWIKETLNLLHSKIKKNLGKKLSAIRRWVVGANPEGVVPA